LKSRSLPILIIIFIAFIGLVFLLLLDTAQLCQLAGDAQCVTKQNQFKTPNLVTRLDSTGKSWTISGQADNVAAGAKTQRNVQVIAYFYDSK
jgi:hypothetical protein